MRRITLLALLVSAAGGSLAAPAPARVLVRTTVDVHQPSFPIASHFLGLSFEVPNIQQVLGNSRLGPNRFLLGLLDNITAQGSGAPVIRVGGGSADSSWWNPTLSKPRPNGILFDQTPFMADSLGRFHQESGAPFIITLNLAANRPSYAVDWARATMSSIGRRGVLAYEIGNEPDIYVTRRFGSHRHTRQPGWSMRGYTSAFDRFRRALASLHVPLAGPDTCCGWDQGVPRFVRHERKHLALVTTHQYPLVACPGAKRADRLTIANLLAVRPYLSAMRRLSVLRNHLGRKAPRIRVTETNSGACGGRAGVSDTHAAALWAVDWLFGLAANGMSGVNIHSSGIYAPFVQGYANGAYKGTARPLYYGMLLFARATAHHAKLLFGTSVNARNARGARVRVWATRDGHGHVNVVVVNRDGHHGGSALVTVKHALGSGRAIALRSSSLRSRASETLGGQSVPAGSPDGKLVGTTVSEVVRRGAHDVFRIPVPAASAVLMTVRVRGA